MSTFFYISWFEIFIIFYDIIGYLKSENIVNNNITSIPFFPCVHITYWDLIFFRYLCLFRGHLFNMCLFRGFLIYLCPLRAIDLSILDLSLILVAYSRVRSFPCVLFLWGISSFEPTSLPCFKHILDSFVNYPIGTSIHAGVFAGEICDFVTFFVSMNAFRNWFARFYK